MLADEARAHGLGAVSLRYFNVGGASGPLGEDHEPETHLIPLVLRAAAGTTDHVSILGTDYPTEDGTAIRDYVHVYDLARAHLLALDSTEPGRHEIYNLGSGTGFSVREVIEAARAVTGREIPVREQPRRPGDPPRLVAAAAKARERLGLAARSTRSRTWSATPGPGTRPTRRATSARSSGSAAGRSASRRCTSPARSRSRSAGGRRSPSRCRRRSRAAGR